MCGIVGLYNLTKQHLIPEENLRAMLAMIRHRGPDQFGIYLDEHIGMGNARLSILDLVSGQQPITNEDQTLWIVYNGEIYNYVELRPELEARGHKFTTNTDTEVILHLYEDFGPKCLTHLNGQFSIAIWDSTNQSLFLARDRLGIRPLFYTITDGLLIFGSEIKAILTNPRVKAGIDPLAMDQLFTYWCALSPSTVFQDIYEVPPGHFLLASSGKIKIDRYWELEFPLIHPNDFQTHANNANPGDYLEEFRHLLINATQIRLRSDVPVGAYLSGGIDSSTITAIIQNYSTNKLDTFSITFSDPEFDESAYQLRMAEFLGTNHQIIHVHHEDIGQIFPNVIWHTETPILRTAPAPLFLLSKLVNENNYKVVLTGEGADEFLAGYNIFKEAKTRRFWARNPESNIRPLLLKRLYPYITDLSHSNTAYLTAFFRPGLTQIDSPEYSHAIRWRNNKRSLRFFSEELHQAILSQDTSKHCIQYPPHFLDWDPLNRAQYLEITIFLSQYLLCSQGDRVGMAHSVEGRFPFLDHRLVEFCNRLPPELKLLGLKEKFILKKLAQEWLPEEIWKRPKRPYRAPIYRCFFHENSPDYIEELLSPEEIEQSGLFNSIAVHQLVKKAQSGKRLSETDEMALVGIISSQLLFSQFITHFHSPKPISENEDIKIIRKQSSLQGA